MKNGKKRLAWTSVQISRAEDTRQKESAREENCKDSEADRGRDTSKGIQPRIIPRLARVTSRRSVSATLPTSPATYPTQVY
jgi:hypothetical protein